MPRTMKVDPPRSKKIKIYQSPTFKQKVIKIKQKNLEKNKKILEMLSELQEKTIPAKTTPEIVIDKLYDTSEEDDTMNLSGI